MTLSSLLLSLTFLTAALPTANICRAQSFSMDSVRILLKGSWRSINDRKDTWHFSNNALIERYEGEIAVDTDSYVIAKKSCAPILDSSSDTGYYLLRINQPDHDTLCYAIENIDANNLNLLYEGGKTWIFERIHTTPRGAKQHTSTAPPRSDAHKSPAGSAGTP